MGLTPEQFSKLVTRDEFEKRLTAMESRLVSKEEFHHVLDAVMNKLSKMKHDFFLKSSRS